MFIGWLPVCSVYETEGGFSAGFLVIVRSECSIRWFLFLTDLQCTIHYKTSVSLSEIQVVSCTLVVSQGICNALCWMCWSRNDLIWIEMGVSFSNTVHVARVTENDTPIFNPLSEFLYGPDSWQWAWQHHNTYIIHGKNFLNMCLRVPPVGVYE